MQSRRQIVATLVLISLADILVTDADDPQLIVEQEQGSSSDDTKLPNSHSAALAMAFIFFCLVSYGVYRLCKWKCCRDGRPLSVSFGSVKKADLQGMEDFLKEREAYLEIYGQRKSISTISGFVSRDGTVENSVVIPMPNSGKTQR